MKLPEETVVEMFLPTFRHMLAKELAAKGLRESKVAGIMGLSQAAISKYRLGKTKTEKAFMEDEATQKVVKEVAEGLSKEEISPLEALAMVLELIRRHEARGLLCKMHEIDFPAIAGMGCNICLVQRGSDTLEEELVLSNMRSALRLLETTRRITDIIPNVGTNIAMAKKDAKDLKDVAAVPGRIYEMRGGVKIPAAPEFEASTHVAGLVLAVHNSNPKIRASINVMYSEEIVAACSSLGWKLLEVKGEYRGREEELTKKLQKVKETPTVIYHLGSYGIEPMLYIVGNSAVDVAEKVRELVSKLKI